MVVDVANRTVSQLPHPFLSVRPSTQGQQSLCVRIRVFGGGGGGRAGARDEVADSSRLELILGVWWHGIGMAFMFIE